MKERADELDAKERVALLAKRKAEVEAVKAAKYAAIQKKEQAEAEAAARTRAAAAAAVAAAPKPAPVATPPAPKPAPVVVPVTPVEAIWEVPEVDTKEAVAEEKAMKLQAEEFARSTLEKQKRKEQHDQERRQAAEARMQRFKEAEAAKQARYLVLQNREKAKEEAARALLQSFTNAPVKVTTVIPTEGKAKDAGDHTWEVPEVDYKEEPATSKVVPTPAPVRAPAPAPAPAPVATSSSTPGLSEKWDDAAIESLESTSEESLPLKYGEAAEKPEMKIFDEMQAAAEKEGAAMESSGSGVKGSFCCYVLVHIQEFVLLIYSFICLVVCLLIHPSIHACFCHCAIHLLRHTPSHSPTEHTLAHYFTGALDEAITLMAKAPLSKLRDLIRKYKPSALPPDESKIGFAGDDMVGTQHTRSYAVQHTHTITTPLTYAS